MRITKLLVFGGLLVMPGGRASPPAAQRSTYRDAIYGFALSAPRFPKAGPQQAISPVMLLGPAENGLASNVNVLVLPLSTTRKAYHDRSMAEFKASGAKVNSDRNFTVSGREGFMVDYEAKPQDRDLRFLALAVIDKGRVLLITCTAPRVSYAKFETEFKACLNSFKLTK